jgi:hypothetical protein
MEGYELIRLILRTYPDLSNILAGQHGTGAVHAAAYWANIPAIQMIKEHVEQHCPGRAMPWSLECSSFKRIHTP